MLTVSSEMFALITIGLVIGLVVLLVLQVLTGLRVQRLTYPIYEYAQSKSQSDADHIISQAREMARKMIADAEMAASTLLDKQRVDIDAHTNAYREALDTLVVNARLSIEEGSEKVRTGQMEVAGQFSSAISGQSATIKASLEQIQEDLKNLSKSIEAQTNTISKTIEEAHHGAAEGFSRTLEGVSSESKRRIDERVEMLLKILESDIEAYRNSRKRLVDEHMVDLIAETSKVVLRKALTSDDHTELVEDALKEARSAGML